MCGCAGVPVETTAEVARREHSFAQRGSYNVCGCAGVKTTAEVARREQAFAQEVEAATVCMAAAVHAELEGEAAVKTTTKVARREQAFAQEGETKTSNL